MQRQRLHHGRGVAAGAALLGVAALVMLASCGGGDRPGVSFEADVQPIFDAKCVACHPVAYPYLDLRRGQAYDDLYRVSARTRPAFERVLPYRPELSYLLTHPPDPSLADLLTAGERRTITEWIREGARDN
jgi:hypothetical protein